MEFFHLSDDIIKTVLFEWVSLRDLLRLESALMNHRLRLIYFNVVDASRSDVIGFYDDILTQFLDHDDRTVTSGEGSDEGRFEELSGLISWLRVRRFSVRDVSLDSFMVYRSGLLSDIASVCQLTSLAFTMNFSIPARTAPALHDLEYFIALQPDLQSVRIDSDHPWSHPSPSLFDAPSIDRLLLAMSSVTSLTLDKIQVTSSDLSTLARGMPQLKQLTVTKIEVHWPFIEALFVSNHFPCLEHLSLPVEDNFYPHIEPEEAALSLDSLVECVLRARTTRSLPNLRYLRTDLVFLFLIAHLAPHLEDVRLSYLYDLQYEKYGGRLLREVLPLLPRVKKLELALLFPEYIAVNAGNLPDLAFFGRTCLDHLPLLESLELTVHRLRKDDTIVWDLLQSVPRSVSRLQRLLLFVDTDMWQGMLGRSDYEAAQERMLSFLAGIAGLPHLTTLHTVGIAPLPFADLLTASTSPSAADGKNSPLASATAGADSSFPSLTSLSIAMSSRAVFRSLRSSSSHNGTGDSGDGREDSVVARSANLMDTDIQALARFAFVGRLQHLVLFGNFLSDEGVMPLLVATARGSLRSLNLHSTSLTARTTDCLLQHHRMHRTLQKLTLITWQGFDAVQRHPWEKPKTSPTTPHRSSLQFQGNVWVERLVHELCGLRVFNLFFSPWQSLARFELQNCVERWAANGDISAIPQIKSYSADNPFT